MSWFFLGMTRDYHKTQINNIHSGPYYVFRADWEQGIKLTNAIEAQLNLLYEFVQNENLFNMKFSAVILRKSSLGF